MEEFSVTPERIVAELAEIAFSDLGDYIRIHPDGTASIELGNMPTGATRGHRISEHGRHQDGNW